MGELKNRERINFVIDKKIMAALRAYSAETGIPMSKLVDRALRALPELQPYL